MRVTIAGYQTDGAGEKIEKFHAHGFLPGPGRAVPPGGQVVDAGVADVECQRRDAFQRDPPHAGRHFAPHADRHAADARNRRNDPPRSLRRGSAAGGIPSYGAGRESPAAYFRTGGMGRGEQGGYSGRPQEVLNDIRRASVPSG